MRPSFLMVASLLLPACEGMTEIDEPAASFQGALEADVFDPELFGYEAGVETETNPQRREYEAFIERTEARLDAVEDWVERIEELHDEVDSEDLRPRDEAALEDIESLQDKVQDGLSDLSREIDRLESQDPAITPVMVEQTRKRIEQDLRKAERISAASWKRLQAKAKEFEP